ncbi:MAG: transcriptional regulator GcvA [Caulobacteraceae bacterium]|nr:transcriptional regulator GcvA [Caulobacteraceae bacterium]
MTARTRLPLTALRVFEAAARHQSFLRAADELAITPGAVSRQVKALETELQLRLFERFNRAVRLTEAGQRLAVGVRQGLSVMEAAVEDVRSARDAPLVVTSRHSFAARWLAPRLHLFQARYPEIQVHMAASDAATDLVRDRVDVAVRYGRGPYPSLHATVMMDSLIFPVCSPRLLEDLALDHPRDLARAQLLADMDLAVGEPSWTEWFAAAGAPEVTPDLKLGFSNTYLGIEAALAGRGVVLVTESLVVDELASGRLVRPFQTAVVSPYRNWILSLPEKADQPNIRRFRDWLLVQAEADGLRAVG